MSQLYTTLMFIVLKVLLQIVFFYQATKQRNLLPNQKTCSTSYTSLKRKTKAHLSAMAMSAQKSEFVFK